RMFPAASTACRVTVTAAPDTSVFDETLMVELPAVGGPLTTKALLMPLLLLPPVTVIWQLVEAVETVTDFGSNTPLVNADEVPVPALNVQFVWPAAIATLFEPPLKLVTVLLLTSCAMMRRSKLAPTAWLSTGPPPL